MAHTRKPWRPPNAIPTMHYDILCYRKLLDKTLRITREPILHHLHERAKELVNNPYSDQEHCEAVVKAILERRHTKAGVQEREEYRHIHDQPEKHDEWLKQRNLHHIVKPES